MFQEHYKSRATCLAQFSHKIQNCFNFYENWHNQQINNANFNDAITFWAQLTTKNECATISVKIDIMYNQMTVFLIMQMKVRNFNFLYLLGPNP